MPNMTAIRVYFCCSVYFRLNGLNTQHQCLLVAMKTNISKNLNTLYLCSGRKMEEWHIRVTLLLQLHWHSWTEYNTMNGIELVTLYAAPTSKADLTSFFLITVACYGKEPLCRNELFLGQ